jgi:hypothetical protein
MALTSMILGIVGLVTCFIVIPSLLALIFGLIAARKIKRSAGTLKGSGQARAGWIMGIVGLLAGGTLITLAATGVLDDGETAVFDLEVGDCVNFPFNPDSERIVEVRSVDVVDCDEDHEAEVIRRGELNPNEDREYPSNDDLFAESYDGCGRDDDTNLFAIAPNEDSWDDEGGPFVCFELSDG